MPYHKPPPVPFASDPARSRGRLYDEPESRTRSPYQRDRDRIMHSGAFRRLKHKTQVFVYHEGDYYRTRLTHSLEVAQIARSISRQLGLDEDLTEVLALAHDLGHTPFGHAGETALNQCMEPFGGFDHNAQSLRVVTSLEHLYAAFDGLNLTWETLEGLVKHNGPVVPPGGKSESPSAILTEYCARHDLELHSYPGPEAQVAALADDIAYNNHDLDDGLRAGLFDIDEVAELPHIGGIVHNFRDCFPALEQKRLIHEVTSQLIGAMIRDVIEETRQRIKRCRPADVCAVRALDGPLVGFSETMASYDTALKKFLFRSMYRHYRVNRMMSKASRLMTQIFDLYLREPNLLPPDWQERCAGSGGPETARQVCDYVAGMTDRFAMNEYKRLFDLDIVQR